MRKVIYTIKAIESVNKWVRRALKNRGSLPSDEAGLKLIYLALEKLSEQWRMGVKDWRAALNQLAILFEGSLPLV
jgi:transposase-like protein